MRVIIPTTKIKFKDSKAISSAVKAFRKSKLPVFSKKDLEISLDSEYYYVPYWIGEIGTQKERALAIYPDKKITFYLVCNGSDSLADFIVLRNVPKTKKIDVKEDHILPLVVSEEDIYNTVIPNAIEDRINRQYIFGPPHILSKKCYLMYLPLRKVQIKKKTGKKIKTYYVNPYTGETKTYARIANMIEQKGKNENVSD